MAKLPLLALLAVFAAAFPAHAAPGQRPRVTVVFVGGTLIDGTSPAPLPDAVVLVDGERIDHRTRRRSLFRGEILTGLPDDP